MAFDLRWSPEARDHLARLPTYQRVLVIDESVVHLKDQADQPSKKRKLLKENPLATWELRLGDLRVFYNIDTDSQAVEIVAVGVKEHDRLLIGGEEIEL